MKVSYNLLKEFIKINVAPDKLAETVTDHSVEMLLEQSAPQSFPGIVTAKVLDVRKHPNADRLRLVKVEVADKIIEPVVCGAFNFGAGDVVALALPGAHIAQNIHSETHEPFVLAKAKIRGIESQGMICAAFELGLSKDTGEGILLLDKSTKSGLALEQALPKPSHVFEVAVPANRPDLHSHWGMAREIGAILNLKFTEASAKTIKIPKNSKGLKVTVKNKKLSPRYNGIKMSVTVGPSPEFLQDLLTSLGLRPINNVVDITNLIMLELGQPTHAFDASRVTGSIVVKTARNGEKFTALNHKEYILDNECLVIADQKKTLALAGIIGGLESEVTLKTTEIILEVANFQATGIRKTSRRVGIRTDGAAIWEKGVHPNLAEIGTFRAIELLTKYADAKILDVATFKGSTPPAPTITFTANNVNQLLGSNFKPAEIKKLLARYDIKVSGSDKLKAVIPWWRVDLQTPEDLAEELIKLKGYNSVTPQALSATPRPATETSGTNYSIFQRQTKETWARLGFFEAQNYNFVSEKDIANFGETRPHIEITNPKSSDQRFLKRHLLIPLLKNVAANQNRALAIKLFEVGKQYLGFENEPTILSALLLSKNETPEKLLMQAKGAILQYLQSLGHTNATFSATTKPWLEIRIPGSGANEEPAVTPPLAYLTGKAALPTPLIKAGDSVIGLTGLIEQPIAKRFNIDYPVIFIKLEIEKLFYLKKDIRFQEISRLQNVERDISIIVPKDVSWEQIEQAVWPVSNLISNISLFEAPFLASEKSSLEYHENLAKQGKKNYGIHLIFKPKNHTLTDPEITGFVDKIVLKLKQELKAEIR